MKIILNDSTIVTSGMCMCNFCKYFILLDQNYQCEYEDHMISNILFDEIEVCDKFEDKTIMLEVLSNTIVVTAINLDRYDEAINDDKFTVITFNDDLNKQYRIECKNNNHCTQLIHELKQSLLAHCRQYVQSNITTYKDFIVHSSGI